MGGTARWSGPGVARAEWIGELYVREAGAVQRMVARQARVPRPVIEDACQLAWERLLAHWEVRLDRPAVMRWLVVTAAREAWREHKHELPVGSAAVLSEAAAATIDPLEAVLAQEEVRSMEERFGALSVRERNVLGLHAAGLCYREIGERTGASVRTVERLMVRGRRKLQEQPPDENIVRR